MNYNEYIGPHFKFSEFRCKCCGKLPAQGIDPNLVLKLEFLRMILDNKPMTIISGYRCLAHNKEVSGATNSQHLYGRAADIIVKDFSPSDVAKAAEPLLFNGGLGRYKTFTHIDVRGIKARW